MRKGFLLIIVILVVFSANSQEKKKDTVVETEVVNVVTKYNPKIADVKKIKNNPTIQLLKKSDKKKLKYSIFSAPVASTFIPKTGVVKGINVGVKERVYNNYFAAGIGNYISPYAELFIYHNTRFNDEYGVHATFNSSEENIKDTKLNSTFLNFKSSTYFKKEERYFDWKVGLDVERNHYNWYGLPTDILYSEAVINGIEEDQNYTYFKTTGHFKFHDSYIDYGNITASYFTDKYNSSEIYASFNTKLDFPLDFINYNLNTISFDAGVEVLNGNFTENYNNSDGINYNIITAKLIPEYKHEFGNLLLKASLRTFVSVDTENDITNFFMFPDLFLQTPIYKQYVNIYTGLTGNLETNTYKKFTEVNPYVSPSLFITQTAESSNIFLGLKGNLTKSISYNIKASVVKEEDKPLFLRNNTKSNGNSTSFNGKELKGYEYGNSFTIFYDDVKSNTIFAEFEYLFNKNLTFSTQVEAKNYTTLNALESWNLPSLQGAFLAKYKKTKWYATANIFYVDERMDALYNAEFPSSLSGIQTLDPFVDVNLDGGYHFNDKFSAFLKLNNVLNTNYQRFANFNTQGFQALAGFTYKFDF
ncbi:TonB-dependent receptor [Polaribacter sp. BM10]|uniref:TonB-dependent receptor n=1 Tax=Polaribacter sp. BM10 TaxID=1529069 RepID=UPI0020C824EA|nr:TonB-dependent receptor [Polaribacter sp. BM10]